MANPITAGVTLRPELLAFEDINLAESRMGFIASKVFPMIEVGKPSGTVGKRPLAQLLKPVSNLNRAPGGAYARTDSKFDTYTYSTQERGLEEPVDDNDREVYADYMDADKAAVDHCVDGILRAQEQRVADIMNDTAQITNTTAAGTVWTTIASATPIANVITAMKAVRLRIGRKPNTIIIPWARIWDVWRSTEMTGFLKQQNFVDMRLAEMGGSLDRAASALASVFGVDQVLVPDALYNSAAEGATASLAEMWDADKVVVCHVAKSSDPREMCVGRQFHWGGDGSAAGGIVEQYRREDIRSDVFRVRHQTGEKLLYQECAQIITGCA